MSWRTTAARVMGWLRGDETRDRILREEIGTHIEMATEENLERGMSPEEARRAAMVRFGNTARIHEDSRAMWSLPELNSVLQDARYGLRLLRRYRAYALTVVLVLTIGIAATSAMFSVVYCVLLRPLPFRDSKRLVYAYNTLKSRGMNQMTSSPIDVAAMRAENKTFEHLAGFYSRSYNLTGSGEPQKVRTMIASYDLFDMLQVAPVVGRTFMPNEEQFGNHRVVVVSEGLLKQKSQQPRDVLGRTMMLNGEPYTVIGVIPGSFEFIDPKVQLWVPMSFAPGDNLNSHNNYFVTMVGRLKSGVSVREASADLDTIMHRIGATAPESGGMGAAAEPLQEALVGDVRTALLVLFGAVGCVLLIACANIASMQLARAATRAREIAVRTAVGATPARLLRQFITESVVLSLLGGVLGLLIASASLRMLVAFAPRDLPRLNEIHLNATVAAFTFVVAILTGVVFGLAPAAYSRLKQLSVALRDGVRSSEGGSRKSLRSMLVIAEVAIAFVLLIGAGLMLKSFHRLRNVSAGFDATNVLTMELRLPDSKYSIPELEKQWSPLSAQKKIAFFTQLISNVRSLPGVQKVGAISSLPLQGETWAKQMTLLDRPEPRALNDVPIIQYRSVAGDYFQSLGISLVRGRYFTDDDGLNTPPVIIVNETFARRHFADADPIGKQLRLDPPAALVEKGSTPPGYVPPVYTIVGVVHDVRYGGLANDPKPLVYGWYPQGREVSSLMYLSVRTVNDPLNYVSAVREQVWKIDRDQPVAEIFSMQQLAAESLQQPKVEAMLLGSFAGFALLLACLGIYGLISYSVAQQVHEIGIRIALGAARSEILQLVVRRGMQLTLIGLGVGIPAAFMTAGAMKKILFGVKSSDPAVFLFISMIIVVIAVVASYIPARRAMNVDPVIALRQE